MIPLRMERREFLAGVFGVLTAPPAARAQAVKRPVIGMLNNGNPTAIGPQGAAFRRGLRERGWVEGETVAIESRWAEGQPERLPSLMAELVRLKPDVIVVTGSAAIRAAQRATTTIPVVFVVLVDPVEAGFVTSLARPGGNMTGVASQFEDLSTKQLEFLKETIPTLSRVALLHRPELTAAVLSAAQRAARRLGLAAHAVQAGTAAELEDAFRAARSANADAMQVLPSPYFAVRQRQLIDLAAKYRLPAIYEFKNYVEAGGLMSYGPSINEMYGRLATYVDRILRGTPPGEVPIERPAAFELVINLKTARALGLTIPQSVLLRADEVIQ